MLPERMQDEREFIYRVNAENRITFANAEWYDFARENGDTDLSPDAVIGSLIWKFICNAETRHLFDVVLSKVRGTGESVTLPYRCDSPGCRRFMELRIAKLGSGDVEFRSRIVRLEHRARVRLMENETERTAELLVMCGWCKKVVMPDERWVEVEDAISELELFHTRRLPGISHGICSDCGAELLARAS